MSHMGLQQQLDAFKAEFARTAPPGRPALYEAKIDELRASFALERAVRSGNQAPDFTLPDPQGRDVSLGALLKEGPAVITFYRGGWCPYCNIQLRELTFAVLSDLGNSVARSFGLVWLLPEELRGALRSNDKALPGFNGDDSWELPVPATYVVARDGRIALAAIDVDYRNRLEPDAILTTLRSLGPM